MRNKVLLFVNVGILFLIIGASFLVGTIYRSTNNDDSVFYSGPVSTTQGLTVSSMRVMSPRNCLIDVTVDAPVDIYLLDSKGVEQWLLDGTLNPIWVAKNTTSEYTSIRLSLREKYTFMYITPNDSEVNANINIFFYGIESDLLCFSLILLLMGLVITIISKIALLHRERKSAINIEKDNKPVLLPKETIATNASRIDVGVDKLRFGGQLRKLLVWELEECFAFPMLEIVVIVAIFTVLSPAIIETLPVFSYVNLVSGIGVVFMFLSFLVGVLFCHSYAGSLSSGEAKMILSYPVLRGKLFLAKFMALFIVLFVVYVGVFVFQMYFLSLSPFEPMFYVLLLLVALELLLVCCVATVLSVVTKNELLSILASALLFFGLEFLVSGNSLVTFAGRFYTGFNFMRQHFYGGLSSVSLMDGMFSIFVTFGLSVLLFVFSYVYFTRKMEID